MSMYYLCSLSFILLLLIFVACGLHCSLRRSRRRLLLQEQAQLDLDQGVEEHNHNNPDRRPNTADGYSDPGIPLPMGGTRPDLYYMRRYPAGHPSEALGRAPADRQQPLPATVIFAAPPGMSVDDRNLTRFFPPAQAVTMESGWAALAATDGQVAGPLRPKGSEKTSESPYGEASYLAPAAETVISVPSQPLTPPGSPSAAPAVPATAPTPPPYRMHPETRPTTSPSSSASSSVESSAVFRKENGV